MTNRSAEGIDRSPLHLLHRASQCSELIFGNVMKGGLTPRQLDMLRTVAAHALHSRSASPPGPI
jgi:hypothetical protein